VSEFVAAVGADIPFVDEDEPLDGVLRRLCAELAAQSWTLRWSDAQ
jgi:hypothetical protein